MRNRVQITEGARATSSSIQCLRVADQYRSETKLVVSEPGYVQRLYHNDSGTCNRYARSVVRRRELFGQASKRGKSGVIGDSRARWRTILPWLLFLMVSQACFLASDAVAQSNGTIGFG